MKDLDLRHRSGQKTMAEYLPRETRIIRTPDLWNNQSCESRITSIKLEEVTIQTTDLIAAFMRIQEQALERAMEEYRIDKRQKAIGKIQNMIYFDRRMRTL